MLTKTLLMPAPYGASRTQRWVSAIAAPRRRDSSVLLLTPRLESGGLIGQVSVRQVAAAATYRRAGATTGVPGVVFSWTP